jgi:putative ABC transport system permease protein
LLAILVCCLGLFGLAALSAQRRTKEIGVRKVLGASVGQIVMMFSTEFIALVAFASFIAWPLAYYMLNDWLANFSFRIGLDVSVFVLSSLLAIVIALITVSYQAWKAAQTNPIDALKYE